MTFDEKKKRLLELYTRAMRICEVAEKKRQNGIVPWAEILRIMVSWAEIDILRGVTVVGPNGEPVCQRCGKIDLPGEDGGYHICEDLATQIRQLWESGRNQERKSDV